MSTYMYAEYPTVKLYKNKGDKKNAHELLWGDWVEITGAKSGEWYPVHARGEDGWMKAKDLREDRILEIVFVDVGQGDGCLVVTPEDKHIIVDAGVSDNMYRYLKWRYGGFKKKWKFEAAVISHPDKDHYYGFRKLFEEPNVSFDSVFHNGIIEAKGKKDEEELGQSQDIGGIRYITELMETQSDLSTFLADTKRWKDKTSLLYPDLLNAAMTSGRVANIEMLSTTQGVQKFLPGYTKDKDLSIQIVGPVAETDGGTRSMLRWFKKSGKGSFDKGQTKNGHSVLLRLRYRDVSIMLAGDLNAAAERFLLKQHVQQDPPAENAPEEDKLAFIHLARDFFECEITKSCHHGSADFTDLFLQACNPIATIISSGDEESYAHPRADTLGAIGKCGRGNRPLIFSTELARSTRESEPADLQVKLRKKQIELEKADDPEKKKEIKAQLDKITDKILTRNVTVYGAIHLRTDGCRVVVAQKLEKERESASSLQVWDVYRLEPDAQGALRLANA